VFHWLLALCFTGAYATSESTPWVGVHLTLGYTMVGLVAFRIVWGLIGTRHARFGSFIRSPTTVFRYASTLFDDKPPHPVGHNPMGAVSIILMLMSTLAVVGTGWFYFNGGARSLKEIHEAAAGLMLAVVCTHVAGVVFVSVLHGENLVRSMLHGHKQGSPNEGIGWSWWPIALILVSCVLGFWWLQWQGSPASGQIGQRSQFQILHHDDD
jgi:cytochrome b